MRAGDRVERPRLEDDVVAYLGGRDRHVAAAEAAAIGERDMSADRDAAGDGGGDGGPHRRRVSGVEAAGDVRARDDPEQRGIVGELPDAVALAEVAVEVDRESARHRRFIVRRAPTAHPGCSGASWRCSAPAGGRAWGRRSPRPLAPSAARPTNCGEATRTDTPASISRPAPSCLRYPCELVWTARPTPTTGHR